MRFVLLLVLGLSFGCSREPSRDQPAVVSAPTETERIEQLLAKIVASNLTFIRNGSEHTATEAVEHLRSKWAHAKDSVTTVEQFIDQLASRSSTTGRPYRVRLVDGTERDAGPWMHEQLSAPRP